MATYSDLDPTKLKPGLTDGGGNLKPSLVTPSYNGGTPTAANQVKPSIMYPDGTLKESIANALGLKPSWLEGSLSALLLNPVLYLQTNSGLQQTGGGVVVEIGDKVAQWLDQTENGNDASQATDSVRPTYKTSIEGNSWVEFEASNIGFNVSDDSSLDFGTGDISVGFWFRADQSWVGSDFGGEILRKASPTDGSSGFHVYMIRSTGQIRFNVGVLSQASNRSFATTTESYKDAKPHFALIMWDNSLGTIRFFIDGVEVGSSYGDQNGSGRNVNNAEPLTIGSREDGSWNYEGWLGDIFIRDSLLDTGDREQLFNLTKSRFQSTETVLRDFQLQAVPTNGGSDSLNRYETTTIGTVSTGTNIASVVGDAFILEDGGRVEYTSELPFSRTDPFSVEFWMRRRDPTGFARYIHKTDDVTNTGSGWRILTTNTLNNRLGIGFDIANVIESSGRKIAGISAVVDLPHDKEVHVVCTYDGAYGSGEDPRDHLRIYLNGILLPAVVNNSSLGDEEISNSQPIHIEGDSDISTGVNYQNVTIYRGLRSSSDIANSYQTGSPRANGWVVTNSHVVHPNTDRAWNGRQRFWVDTTPGATLQNVIPIVYRDADSHSSYQVDSALNIVFYDRSTGQLSEPNTDLQGNSLGSWPLFASDLTNSFDPVPADYTIFDFGCFIAPSGRMILHAGVLDTSPQNRVACVQLYSDDNGQTLVEEGALSVTGMVDDLIYWTNQAQIVNGETYIAQVEMSGPPFHSYVLKNTDSDCAFDQWAVFKQLGSGGNLDLANEYGILWRPANNHFLVFGQAYDGTGDKSKMSWATLQLDGTLSAYTDVTSQFDTNQELPQATLSLLGDTGFIATGGREPQATNQGVNPVGNAIYLTSDEAQTWGNKIQLEVNLEPRDAGYCDAIYLGNNKVLIHGYLGDWNQGPGGVILLEATLPTL